MATVLGGGTDEDARNRTRHASTSDDGPSQLVDPSVGRVWEVPGSPCTHLSPRPLKRPFMDAPSGFTAWWSSIDSTSAGSSGCASRTSENAADAEDATQETFIRSVKAVATRPGDLAPFLTTVAPERLPRRAPAAAVPGREIPDAADRAVEPEAQVLTDTELVRVWRDLSQADRALLAHAFAGYSYDEISRRTGRSLKAISTGIVRARRRARELAGAAAAILGACFGRGVLSRWIGRFGGEAGGDGGGSPCAHGGVDDRWWRVRAWAPGPRVGCVATHGQRCFRWRRRAGARRPSRGDATPG